MRHLFLFWFSFITGEMMREKSRPTGMTITVNFLVSVMTGPGLRSRPVLTRLSLPGACVFANCLFICSVFT